MSGQTAMQSFDCRNSELRHIPVATRQALEPVQSSLQSYPEHLWLR